MGKEKNFDYEKSVKKVEEILSRLESPDLPVTSAGTLINEAMGLINGCRSYLRDLEGSCMSGFLEGDGEGLREVDGLRQDM